MAVRGQRDEFRWRQVAYKSQNAAMMKAAINTETPAAMRASINLGISRQPPKSTAPPSGLGGMGRWPCRPRIIVGRGP